MQRAEIEAAFERLKRRVAARGECWKWMGAIDTHGYGHIRVGEKVVATHRLAYLFAHGSIPRGKVVRHSCDVSDCCNPDHLLIGDHEDNNADIIARGRHKARRVLTDDERARVGDMRRTGATKRAITEALQVNWYAVSRAIDDLGIGRGKGGRPKGSRNAVVRVTDADKLQIAREYRAGDVTQSALGARYGISQDYVSRIVKDHADP